MKRWNIRKIEKQDYKAVVDIYNSNPSFLCHYLGMDSVDVVNDYPDNVVAFWEKLGFEKCEPVQLHWGNRVSSAIVMRKQFVC